MAGVSTIVRFRFLVIYFRLLIVSSGGTLSGFEITDGTLKYILDSSPRTEWFGNSDDPVTFDDQAANAILGVSSAIACT